MKRLFLFLVIFSFKLYAEPMSQPDAPSLLEEGIWIPDTFFFHVRGAACLNYTIDQRLDPRGSLKQTNFNKAVLSTENVSGSIIFNLKERFDLYGSMGGSSFTFQFINNDLLYKGKSETGLFWNVGARLTLFECNDSVFGIDVNYQEQTADTLYFLINEVRDFSLNPDFCYKEFQINTGVSQKIGFFVPYGGVAYNQARLKLDPFTLQNFQSIRLRSRNLVGIFLGCSLTQHELFFLNFEGRFINETSFSLSGQVRF